MRWLCLFLLLANYAFAQAIIDGTVRDTNGKPITGATLTLLRETGAAKQTTASDSEGAFHFLAAEPAPTS